MKLPHKHAHGPLTTKGARYSKPSAKATKESVGRLAKRKLKSEAMRAEGGSAGLRPRREPMSESKPETKKPKTWADCTPFEQTWLMGELQRMYFEYTDEKPTADWAERAAVINAAVEALKSL